MAGEAPRVSEAHASDEEVKRITEDDAMAIVHFRDMPDLDEQGRRTDILEERPIECFFPRRISVSNVVMDWTELEGTFVVTLDDQELAKPFRFSMSPYGIPRSSIPWLYFKSGRRSGVRAYGMFPALRVAIDRALQLVIPAIPGVSRDEPECRSVKEADMNPDEVAIAKMRFATPGILATFEIPKEDWLSHREEHV
jgi:hypothetical protein